MAYQTDNQTAIELYLFATNTREVICGMYDPVARNLERKQRNGAYCPDKSLKAWRRVADYAARLYAKEHCTSPADWNKVFAVQDRNDCARELRASWEGAISAGNS